MQQGASHMRELREIAKEIASDWTTINNGAAREALELLSNHGDADTPLFADPNAYGVIGVFLDNSRAWHGPIARRIKLELREMCGHPRP
jgi:hypothetical protein